MVGRRDHALHGPRDRHARASARRTRIGPQRKPHAIQRPDLQSAARRPRIRKQENENANLYRFCADIGDRGRALRRLFRFDDRHVRLSQWCF